jgi:type IV pilus assembly protein PilV
MIKHASVSRACTRRQRGISIVEVLVALVVISVGMLGIASLYLSSLQASRSAKLRSQAVSLVASIADRIRANRDAAAAYDSSKYGTPATQGCDTKNCSAAALAQDDLARWTADLKSTMPGGTAVKGTVKVTDRIRPNADAYEITVDWREANSDIDFQYKMSMNLANRL